MNSFLIASAVAAAWLAYGPAQRLLFHRNFRVERFVARSKRAVEAGFIFLLLELLIRSWL